MLLEIKKERNKYVLINPPKTVGSHFMVEIEADKIISIPMSRNNTDSNIYQVVKKMASKYPENEFLKISLDLTPKNYSDGLDLGNDKLLNEALSEKYGI
jgi:hypothetical protein